MKNKIFPLLLALIVCAGIRCAERVQIGILYYNLDSLTQTAEVAYQSNQSDMNYYGLTTLTIPSSVEYNSIVYSITGVGNAAFAKCAGLKSVTIPNTVKSLEYEAFSDCTGLTNVYFGSGLTNIGESAFLNCSKFTSFDIPDGVVSIGNAAFQGCVRLLSVTIPNSVKSIGGWAFSECSSLSSVTISNSVTSIGEGAFYMCGNLTNFTIPNNIKSIEGYTFYESGLRNVTIPDSVERIDDGAFAECRSLIGVELPNSLIDIGDYAFHNNDLRSVVLGNQINSIGADAFAGCSRLKSITIHTKVPPILKSSAMPDYDLHTIYVPCGSVNAYKAYWNSQASRIQANPNYQFSLVGKAYPADAGSVKLPVDVCADTIIRAVSAYGYHFVQWSDSVTVNPRKISFTQDTIFTAEFAINPRIHFICDNQMGGVKGDSTLAGTTEGYVTFTAAPNYGYHFVKWGDGETAMTRTIYLTKDTTFSLEFAKNTYTVKTAIDDSIHGQVRGDTTVLYLEQIVITATPNYGYKFFCWADGNTTNPRTISVTRDATYTAVFEKTKFSITKQCDAAMGKVEGPDQAEYLDTITLTATPIQSTKQGYHFVQWSDSITDNPRTFILTQDTTFTAEFEQTTTCKVTTLSADPERGMTKGDTVVPYLTKIKIYAIPNYGYYFSQWSDGNHQNPRSMYINEDKVFTAYFEKNKYVVTINADTTLGSVSYVWRAAYLDTLTLTATPKQGNRFVRWSDKDTTNPRLFVLTQDTTFNAEFAAANRYLVHFYGFDKDLLDVQSVESGSAAIAPEVPIIENYDFVGWDQEFTNVQADLDVYALYEETHEAIGNIEQETILPRKVMIRGQIFILRGEKVYTLQGQLVE